MTPREQRREALRRLVARGSYRTLAELRRELADVEGFQVELSQLWKDLYAIGAWREVRWTIDPQECGLMPDTNPITTAAETYRGTTAAVRTFDVWERATGNVITVDSRSFDPSLHSRDPIAPSEGATHGLD